MLGLWRGGVWRGVDMSLINTDVYPLRNKKKFVTLYFFLPLWCRPFVKMMFRDFFLTKSFIDNILTNTNLSLNAKESIYLFW